MRTRLRSGWRVSTAAWEIDADRIRLIRGLAGGLAGFFAVIALGSWFSGEPESVAYAIAGAVLAAINGAAYVRLRRHPTSATATRATILLALGMGAVTTYLVYLTGALNSGMMMGYPVLVMCTILAATPRTCIPVTLGCIVMLDILTTATRAQLVPYAPAIDYADFRTDDLPGNWATMLVGNLTLVGAHLLASYIALGLRNREMAVRRLDELKSKYLGIVSHDLRTPITSIKAFADILYDEADENTLDQDAAKKFSSTISAEADRLHRLVTDLLDLDKMEAGKMEWNFARQDIRPVLANAATVFAAAAQDKGVTLDRAFAEDFPDITADADRISQLVANLLSNAIKFTPAGGKVTLSATSADGRVHVAVADTGPGIPADARATLFDRFSQTDTGKEHGGGTGLGLSIAREIAHGHGGDIEVTSTVGTGTTFTVVLPLS